MEGILQLHFSNGYLNPNVVLTEYTWNKVIEFWPDIYYGSAFVRKQSFIDRILRRKPYRILIRPNEEWMNHVRKLWADSKTFMLNGYTMRVEII